MENLNETTVQEFCQCPDWEACGCVNQPPYHCMWCCRDLTAEQLAQWDFDNWDYRTPKPKGLPQEIFCGQCQLRIVDPTEEEFNFHFSDEHNGVGQTRRSAIITPEEL